MKTSATMDLVPSEPADPACDERQKTRRLFLAYRRHEMLAPVNAIIEFAAMLLEEESIQATDWFLADLRTVHAYAQRVSSTIEQVFQPAGTSEPGQHAVSDELVRSLNHDLRGLLTVVIGYSEDLLRKARKHRLDAFLAELEQIHRLGQRSTALIDGVVAYLRHTDADADAGAGAADALALQEIDEVVHEVGPAPDDLAPSPVPSRVLVVEDNEDIREVLARHLRRQGHEVAVAGDGVAALEVLRAQAIDLVLLDIVMPRANGLQVLAQMKADPLLREIPVIMVSGLNDFDSAVRCIERGAEDVLPKPYNRVLLRARVEACLEKKRLRDRNEQERKRNDELLHVILPAEVVAELKQTDTVRPRRREDVAVLFADIVGFTHYCDAHPPEEVLPHLQRLVETWEQIALQCQVQKIKTIGDALMATAGLLRPSANPVLDCLKCGLRMISATRALPTGWDLRVGVHVGPVMAGIVGKRQYLYDLWGDTVNIASRLESRGEPGAVTLSEAAWSRVSKLVRGETRSEREIKGKGLMRLVHVSGAAALDGQCEAG